MVDRASYRSLRDQLVSISVDIEDKQKICENMKRKIAKERSKLADVEIDTQKKYEEKLQSLVEQHGEESRQLKEKSQQLVALKADHVERCKALVQQLQKIDRELASEVRSIYREAEQEIEGARKEFRGGYETRLQKCVAAKAQEYKEDTGKALEPEIARLQLMHEREMKEVESYLRAEERKCREDTEEELKRCIEMERTAMKQELQLSKKALEERTTIDLESVLSEKHHKVQRLREDNDKELSKHRAFLSERNEKQRKESHEEIQRQQKNSRQRLLDAKQSHAKEIERLQEAHDTELRLLKKRMDAAQKEGERLIRRNLRTVQSIVKGSPEDTSVRRKNEHSIATLDDSDEAVNHLSGSDADGAVVLTAEDELDIASVQKAAEIERDRVLQTEIRAIETDAMRYERKLRAKAEQEQVDIRTIHSKEQELLDKRSRREVGEATELAVQRDSKQNAVLEAQSRAAVAAEAETALRREISIYREGVAAHTARIDDKKEQHRLQLREVQLNHGPQLREMQQRKEELQIEAKERTSRNSKNFNDLKQEHHQELSRLNDQVRVEVQRRDKEIEELRDAIEAERTKIVRLEKLIKRYSDNAATGTADNSDDDTANAADSRSARSRTTRSSTRSKLTANGRNIRAVNAGIPFSDTSRTTLNTRTSGHSKRSDGSATTVSNGSRRSTISGVRNNRKEEKLVSNQREEFVGDDDEEEQLLPAPPLQRRPYTPPAPPRSNRLVATSHAPITVDVEDSPQINRNSRFHRTTGEVGSALRNSLLSHNSTEDNDFHSSGTAALRGTVSPARSSTNRNIAADSPKKSIRI